MVIDNHVWGLNVYKEKCILAILYSWFLCLLYAVHEIFVSSPQIHMW